MLILVICTQRREQPVKHTNAPRGRDEAYLHRWRGRRAEQKRTRRRNPSFPRDGKGSSALACRFALTGDGRIRGIRFRVQTAAPSLCKSESGLALPRLSVRGSCPELTGCKRSEAAELAAEEEWQETAPAPNLGSPTSAAKEEGEASETEGEPLLPPREPSRGRPSPARLRGVWMRHGSGFKSSSALETLLTLPDTPKFAARQKRLVLIAFQYNRVGLFGEGSSPYASQGSRNAGG